MTPRRPGRWRRWLRRAGAAVVVLATLLAGQAVIRAEPSTNDLVADHLTAGRLNQALTVDDLAVTAMAVRGAATVERPGDGRVVDTSGVWIIVRLRLEVRTESSFVDYLALADHGGAIYRISDRFTQGLSPGYRRLQPGLPVIGDAAFEVPRAVATGLTLRVAQHYNEISGAMVPGATDIALPIQEQDVDRWLRDTTPAILIDPDVVA